MSHLRAPHMSLHAHGHRPDPVKVLIVVVGYLIAVFLILQAIAPRAL